MSQIDNLRAEIDRLDESLVLLLAQRFRVTDKVGKLKKDHQLPAIDEERERQQAKKIKELADQHGLSNDLAQAVLRLIIDEVVRNHKQAAF